MLESDQGIFDSSSQDSSKRVKAKKTSALPPSWPVFLAVAPTVGAFFVGNTDAWSDFILVLLMLFYVYKWVTVPWSYYESARTRHALFQLSEAVDKNDLKRKQQLSYELRCHEIMGLVWVLASPGIGGLTLQFGRYLLSDYNRYMSSFNIAIFVFAASIKPMTHLMTLLRERTLHLQSEAQVSKDELTDFHQRLEELSDEVTLLRAAFATKKDLGQVSDDLKPTIQHLSKALHSFEKKESAMQIRLQVRFNSMEEKVQKMDQYLRYRIEQDQQQHGILVTLVMIPFNLSFWCVRNMIQMPKVLSSSMASMASITDKQHASVPALSPKNHLITS